MYTHLYQFTTNPFRLAPDPKFSFNNAGYKRAREYLDFALSQDEGFVLVTGQPGTGKTLLVETFLKGINTSEVVARRIAVSSYGPPTLLRAAAYAYGIDADEMDESTMYQRIQQFLEQQGQAGRRVLLIIDEAQALSPSALVELNILADLQSQSCMRLQLFFVGREPLQELMRTPDMEKFQKRLIVNYHLVPLTLQDTRSYIEHRLLQVGWKGDPEFSAAAVLSIYHLSNGIPSNINKICNHLLLLGFNKSIHAFDDQDVLEISADMHEERLIPLEINQAPLYDTDDAMNIAEVRNGQLSLTDLAIRVDKVDVCATTFTEGSRRDSQNKEAFIVQQYMPPATRDEQITSPDIATASPSIVTSEPLHTGNAPIVSTFNSDGVKKDHQTDRPDRKKTLAIMAVLLILLTAFIALLPSFPGWNSVKSLLSETDHSPRSGEQIATLQEELGMADIDSEIQAQAKGATASKGQLIVAAINSSEEKAKVPPSVAEVPPGISPPVAGILEQSDVIQTGKIEQLLVESRQAIDDYRLVTPEGNNAYRHLLAVLKLDPENLKARAGIEEIVEIYIMLSTKAIDSNEITRAGRYIDRGLGIQPDNPELRALRDTVNSKVKFATVPQGTESAGGQLTRDNITLQRQPSMKKRQSADRNRKVNAASDQQE